MVKELKIFALTLLLIGNVFAQSRILKGYIVDENFEPLEFAKIKTIQNGNLFLTDKFGKFEFEIAENETEIEVSYIGLHTEKINIHNKCFINIIMIKEYLIEFETVQEEAKFYKKLKRKLKAKYKLAVKKERLKREENCN
ncbi:carboxypeptidase-like regulatory domain-containing protein [Flavobacterium sp.]|uniref:carboxypeptidase-like regulatory domain-containing protein n=1 Tax=Flavobacterium sp. TaxID=239 RepID=UPI0035B4B315